jgi:fructosamine-3-kinase
MFDYCDAIPSEVQGWPLENGKVSSYKFYLQRVYTILGNQKTELECKGMKVLERATEILDTHKIKPSLLHGDLWVNYLFLLCWSIFWELELEMAQYWTVSSREKLSVGETTL